MLSCVIMKMPYSNRKFIITMSVLKIFLLDEKYSISESKNSLKYLEFAKRTEKALSFNDKRTLVIDIKNRSNMLHSSEIFPVKYRYLLIFCLI